MWTEYNNNIKYTQRLFKLINKEKRKKKEKKKKENEFPKANNPGA